MDLLRLDGEGSFSEPPLPEPCVPGCMSAWDTACWATFSGMFVALLMALAILRLWGMVKDPMVAPKARGPPREAACRINTGS